MTPSDLAGVVGVLLTLTAYAGAQIGRLEPRDLPALLLNLTGATLILWSLALRFNLASVLMEGAWAAISLFGVLRLMVGRVRRRP